MARRVEEALRARLGADRYAVWFGDAAGIAVEPAAGPSGTLAAGGCIAIVVGTAFSQVWLKRTFRPDVEAVVRAVCGGAWSVVWRTAPAVEPTAIAVRPAAQSLVSAPVEPACQPAHQGVGVAGAVGVRRQAASLDAFVVGPSNRMAFAAVELAASRPGEMSPLVLHGPSGVGKSHLLEGICGRFRDRHPGATTLLLSAEQFTTSFLQSLHGSGLPGFRRTCRNADLLVIDDLQFFAGKRATLMEVQQTVDALHRQGRQMVFASDRDLSALDGLGPDLLARLRGGMSARIESPDYDVRRGIVAAVAAKRGVPLPDEVTHYVATHMTRHARELIGAINRLEATSHMLGLPVSLGMAEEALADLVRSSARSVRLADIERAVCSAFGLESGCLQSSRRARTVNHPRMLAMFLARRHTTSALTEIGSYFGRRSHSTVISAQKAVGEWVAQRSRIVLADTSWDVEEAIRRVEDVLRAG
ncbi:MAG: DnaA ATPase domain-containing protein [Planctomycetia bacterium]